MSINSNRSPLKWVPSAYFAMGLPFVILNMVCVLMFKGLGIADSQITLWTSIIMFPWTLKFLWSPLLELVSNKRIIVVATQIICGAGLACVALALHLPCFFAVCIGLLAVVGFSGATHDIALDGFYILGLTQEKQSFFSGIRNTFYRIATVFSSGILVMLASRLCDHFGEKSYAWSATFAVTAVIMAILYIYHRRTLPEPKSDVSRTPDSIKGVFKNFGDIIKTYFQKPGIRTALLFLLLFRFPEAQLVKIGKLFLMDSTAAGGLALDKGDIGFIYGVVGVIGLIIGGIAGGICISRKGLKYWLWPMVIAISLPDIVYVYMSMAHTESLVTIGSCIFIEQLGYGFGFTAYTLYMIYFAQGKYPTAHFAISTAFMSLGMMLPGMVSGYIQQWIGYENFFIWVMICTAVTFIVSAFIKIDPAFGKK